MTDKLTYFNARAAGEIIRLIYAVTGENFEDVRVEFDENWPKIKQNFPVKALPVLETSGKMYCQSGAIARFLAKKFGLFGSSDEEGLDIDEVYECVQDSVRETFKFIFEDDKAVTAPIVKKFTDEFLPKLIDYFDYKCKANTDKKGFIVGDKLTLADLAFFALVNSLTVLEYGYLWKEYPAIKKHHNLIASQESIKRWLIKRPKTKE